MVPVQRDSVVCARKGILTENHNFDEDLKCVFLDPNTKRTENNSHIFSNANNRREDSIENKENEYIYDEN